VLVTAFDILFFWVARMMMMGLHFMKEVPFREVYVHCSGAGLSGPENDKSKGNVIDPLIMMDEYGTDALRFTLTALAVQGRDVKLSEERIEGYRHFINKIWNAARLVLMNIDGMKELPGLPRNPEKLMHRWILSRLQQVVRETREAVEGYHFNHYAHVLYQFVWHEYCDWYLEMIKPDFYGENATASSLTIHRRQSIGTNPHPAPSRHAVRHRGDLAEIGPPPGRASWRHPSRAFEEPRVDAEAEEQMALIMEVITGIRISAER